MDNDFFDNSSREFFKIIVISYKGLFQIFEKEVLKPILEPIKEPIKESTQRVKSSKKLKKVDHQKKLF